MKNKISTLSYFTKRLKDNDFVVWKIFDKFSLEDSRKWAVLVNPGRESVFVTCYVNVDGPKSMPVFEFRDGRSMYRNTLKVKTESMEIIIRQLLHRGVDQGSEEYRAEGDKINNYIYEGKKREAAEKSE